MRRPVVYFEYHVLSRHLHLLVIGGGFVIGGLVIGRLVGLGGLGGTMPGLQR